MESNGSRENLQVLYYEDGAKDDVAYKVNNVFVKGGAHILHNKKICELTPISDSEHTLVVKSKFTGIIKKIFIKKSADIQLGAPLIEIEECTHPTMFGNMCGDCGIVMEEEKALALEESSNALVSMLHSIPDLKVSRQEAERLGMEDIKNLLVNKKLVLLVDLDQTLVHTTNDNIPPKLKDVYHFQLMRPNGPWYHTRIRPYTKEFLSKISQLYELHICTFGVREYAHYIAHFLDSDEKLFGHRILSRNECLDPMSKKGNLSSLFPCGDNLVCIIDDRSDVWNFAPNVVQVLPYHFFQHTGDINAPAGLQKRENDDDARGFDFSTIDSTVRQTLKDEEERELSSNKESEDEDSVESEAKTTKDSSVEENTLKTNNASEAPQPSSKPCIKCKDVQNISEGSSEPCKMCEHENKSDEKSQTNRTSSDEGPESDAQKDSSETSAKDVKPPPEPSGDDSLNISVTDAVGEDVQVEMNEDSGLIDVPDVDDYLLYLEDILVNLHEKFYEIYAKRKEIASQAASNEVLRGLPDLKNIVPLMRKEVLTGVGLVFSGIIPHHINLEKSKPYHIAVSLGATISKKIVPKVSVNGEKCQFTTHIVAANLHTEKVRQARKMKHISIVSPNWLWCCAERWERVDERLFQLGKNSEETIARNPPMHCCIHPVPKSEFISSISDKQQQFVEDLNPLAFMTNDEAKSMEEEVDIVLSDDDDDDDEAEKVKLDDPIQSQENKESSESSSSSFEDTPKESSSTEDDDDVGIHKRKRPRNLEDDNGGDSDDELPSVRFRQGGALPSDESAVESDDEDLNAYGDILARELLE